MENRKKDPDALVKSYFNMADSNKDGMITKKELKSAVGSALNMFGSKFKSKTRKKYKKKIHRQAKRIFKTTDTDKDGKLSFDEVKVNIDVVQQASTKIMSELMMAPGDKEL